MAIPMLATPILVPTAAIRTTRSSPCGPALSLASRRRVLPALGSVLLAGLLATLPGVPALSQEPLPRGGAGEARRDLPGPTVPQSPPDGLTVRETVPTEREQVLAWQIALEAVGFSPGIIDGVSGPKTALATRVFQATRGLPATGELCERTRAALAVQPAAAVMEVRVLPGDLASVEYCPPDWHEKSRRKRLLYGTLSECLAEKFHTSRRCLAALNPGVDVDGLVAGSPVRVPAIRAREVPRDVASVEIDLGRKLVLLLAPDGAPRGLLHCSIARDPTSIVRGATHVTTVVADPTYTFDPKKWPEVKDVARRLLIPPGPRCPVGLRWIGLALPGVGVHGAPEPENIGKTGSHGCFRLTNWDAVHLSAAVSVEMPVRILDRSMALDQVLARR